MRRRARCVVLLYHRLGGGEGDPDEAPYTLNPSLFERQMDLLVVEGRPVVALSALLSAAFPDGAVALTFDDGCDSDLQVALPVLRARSLPAAFFVNPGRIDHEGYLSWTGLERLAEAGMHIGCHGLDHSLLDGLPARELERQLGVSKRLLEARLGRPIEALSLPGGTGGRRAARLGRALGYRAVLGSLPGVVRDGRSPGVLPRFAVRREWDVPRFRAVIDQRLPLRLALALRCRLVRLAQVGLGPRVYARVRRVLLARPPAGAT